MHFNHPGIPITVSSGDNGYGVEYPASSPYVTAVGGTSLSRAANARGWTETRLERRRQRLLGLRGQADLADRRRLRQAHGRRRLRGRRPQHGRGGLRQQLLRLNQLLGNCFRAGASSVAPARRAPIIASVYALAGNAPSTTYGSFPYSHASRSTT